MPSKLTKIGTKKRSQKKKTKKRKKKKTRFGGMGREDDDEDIVIDNSKIFHCEIAGPIPIGAGADHGDNVGVAQNAADLPIRIVERFHVPCSVFKRPAANAAALLPDSGP